MRVGSDFSGVGAFEQALKRLKIDYNTVFACDLDKYARQTYLENNGDPDYFPNDVYDRDIPAEPLDIYMTSPPCQSFSLAGSRKGEQDNRGVLFYNSHEFIKANRPRYFIFENVKGLLSDDNGKTFQRWIDYLAKSVNGQPVIFPHDQSVMYHVYYRVLNSKDFGVPQNRERIFIIGIRDDKDNYFRFPKKEYLAKKLKDVLESEVDDKYYLSESAITTLNKHNNSANGFKFETNKLIAKTIRTAVGKQGTEDNYIKTHSLYPRSSTTGKGGTRHLTKEDGTAYAIDTGNSQAIEMKILVSKEVRTKESKEKRKATGTNDFRGKKLEFRKQDYMNAITTSHTKDHLIKQAKIRRLTPRECFRLQDFPDSFTWTCSDSQAYKQAGNSITVGVLEKLLNKLLHL